MAIYKRGSIYWYKFEFNHKRYQASTKVKNRVKAQMIEDKLRTDLALGVYGLQAAQPGPSFKDYAPRFREYIQVHNKQHPETISFYLEKLARLLDYKPLADCRLNFIDEALIEEYKQHRLKSVSFVTTNKELATLRRALNVARKTLKVMQTAPQITLIPGESERTFVLTYAQEAAYLGACPQPLKDAALLMLDAGLRVGEVRRLEWDDFTDDYRVMLVKGKKSKHAFRGVFLSERCRAMLTLRRAFFPDTIFLFPGRSKDKPILRSSLDHQHTRARLAARLEDGSELPAEFVIHSLRHTFGTRFAEIESSPFTIKRAMGHSSVKVSQVYIHPTDEALERAFDRLDAMNRLMRGEVESSGDKIGDRPLLGPVSRWRP